MVINQGFQGFFSHIRTEYGEIRSISPYSVWMRENTDWKNSKYGHFSHSEVFREFHKITKFRNWNYETWKPPPKFSEKHSPNFHRT